MGNEKTVDDLYKDSDEATLERYRDQLVRQRFEQQVREEMDAAVEAGAQRRLVTNKLAEVLNERNAHQAKLSQARLKLYWLWKTLKERHHPEMRKAAVGDLLALFDDLGRYLGESVLPENPGMVKVELDLKSAVSWNDEFHRLHSKRARARKGGR